MVHKSLHSPSEIHFHNVQQEASYLKFSETRFSSRNVDESVTVSVVIVTLNCVQFLDETLKSLASQRYCSIEFVFVDGGSTDGTVALVQRFINASPHKTVFVSEKDHGIFDAMNKGLRLATGQLVSFINAGDEYCSENSIDHFVESYRDVRWRWAYGFAKLKINFKKTKYRQPVRAYKSCKNLWLTQCCHQATMFHRSVFCDVGAYLVGCDSVSDYEFNLRLAKVSEPHVIKEYIVWYDITGFSSKPRFSALLSRMKIASMYSSGWVFILAVGMLLVRFSRSCCAYMVKHALMWYGAK